MKVAQHIPNFGTPNPALLTFALFAIILMFEPDQSLPERSLFLPKIAAADDAQTPVRAKPMPPARDPKIAIAEEYKLALDRGTVQALELFITRHSDDPLADKARVELQRLRR